MTTDGDMASLHSTLEERNRILPVETNVKDAVNWCQYAPKSAVILGLMISIVLGKLES
jgi:hypothetical protein